MSLPISDWSNPKEKCHVVERKAQVKKKIALVSLTKEAQAVTSRNDSLAILRLGVSIGVGWLLRLQGCLELRVST
ncbi:hypothetical protein Tco_0458983 [Tanacetum coccineum]